MEFSIEEIASGIALWQFGFPMLRKGWEGRKTVDSWIQTWRGRIVGRIPEGIQKDWHSFASTPLPLRVATTIFIVNVVVVCNWDSGAGEAPDWAMVYPVGFFALTLTYLAYLETRRVFRFAKKRIWPAKAEGAEWLGKTNHHD